MADETLAWQIQHDGDEGSVRVHALLEQDRVWNCFALADLLPPMRPYTRFPCAGRAGESTSALLLVIEHPNFTTISPFGIVSGVSAILTGTALPQTALIQTLAEHRPALEAAYRPVAPWREMLRMAVTRQTFIPQQARELTVPLTVADAGEVESLLRLNPETPFYSGLLEQGSFFGLRVDGHLLAIAGTHTVTEPFGIAVVGNVFTHPEARNRGYAGMVTSAVVAHLLEIGCRDVVLNVFATNTPAIAAYQRLGFQTRHHLWSGPAELRQQSQKGIL